MQVSISEAWHKVYDTALAASSISTAENDRERILICAKYIAGTALAAYVSVSGKSVSLGLKDRRLNCLGRAMAIGGFIVSGSLAAVSVNEVLRDEEVAHELSLTLGEWRGRSNDILFKVASRAVDVVMVTAGYLSIHHKDPFGC